MSISENVGSMSNYLNKFRIGEHYNGFKEDVEKSLNKIPKVGQKIVKRLKRTKDSLKNLIISGGFFDDLGITYIGPVDGHNIEQMIEIFNGALKIDHPILIHVKTIKGKGYNPAEKNPSKYHGVNPFDINTGKEFSESIQLSYTDVFSNTIVDIAKKDEKVVTITAAMPDGTGLTKFAREYPDRFFDVGIAEEHAVTFAAGLATSGYKPFVSIYSSFYQRAYDQILHDVCLQNLPVVFIVDRAGLVGKDGETHQGIFDISFMSAIPNLTIVAPKDAEELMQATKFAADFNGPIAVRFPRGKAFFQYAPSKFEYGKSEILKEGENVAIIAVGGMVEETKKAVDLLEENNKNVTFVNARFIKPIDYDMIDYLAKDHDFIITVEEGIKRGGYGEGIETYIMENDLNIKVVSLAIDDMFVEQGAVEELRERIGISYKDIYEKVLKLAK